jgi:ADP-ribose pyrophosphatase
MPPEDLDTILAEGRFLRLVRRGRWEFAERNNATAAVVIVAVTDDARIILVEQERAPLGRRVIELPAGLVGDEPGGTHESVLSAARRELLEEAGYEASELWEIMSGPTSAGLSTEVVTLVAARGLRKVGAGGGTEHEVVEVHAVALHEAPQWLEARMRAGVMVDPKVYAGLYFAAGFS